MFGPNPLFPIHFEAKNQEPADFFASVKHMRRKNHISHACVSTAKLNICKYEIALTKLPAEVWAQLDGSIYEDDQCYLIEDRLSKLFTNELVHKSSYQQKFFSTLLHSTTKLFQSNHDNKQAALNELKQFVGEHALPYSVSTMLLMMNHQCEQCEHLWKDLCTNRLDINELNHELKIVHQTNQVWVIAESAEARLFRTLSHQHWQRWVADKQEEPLYSALDLFYVMSSETYADIDENTFNSWVSFIKVPQVIVEQYNENNMVLSTSIPQEFLIRVKQLGGVNEELSKNIYDHLLT